ncbi:MULTISPECIES: response regulator [Rhizobium]|uniref:Response regulator n=1 Tax=Rhizobium rhododendri TaxID=2506430 RepID=A0ABY8IQ02_9HYPH|nr:MULTISPECIES: response regulator [Rhizobium]MBO9102239.1 response regulator [Rhizobium sp. L58/93]MBO9134592.1 response regulator [Rhizobium sp. B209b/85]MBO9183816.1 response regulator [Rhizobium sp. E27B/91]MBZ5762541.1 response regulator [Rhizobium sp. VS19-DR96]MBZ5768539.1 response regulator [Rhizobium sp. VS19-DR129.2]
MTALRVMIVEDEMLLALDLEDMLLDAGYTVVGQASDMPQALAIAESVDGGIDVAIMDINLARGSNGVATAAALRQRWNIPSLFVSGNLDERTRHMAMQWQPIGFVGKPYSEREVLAVIRTAAG